MLASREKPRRASSAFWASRSRCKFALLTSTAPANLSAATTNIGGARKGLKMYRLIARGFWKVLPQKTRWRRHLGLTLGRGGHARDTGRTEPDRNRPPWRSIRCRLVRALKLRQRPPVAGSLASSG